MTKPRFARRLQLLPSSPSPHVCLALQPFPLSLCVEHASLPLPHALLHTRGERPGRAVFTLWRGSPLLSLASPSPGSFSRAAEAAQARATCRMPRRESQAAAQKGHVAGEGAKERRNGRPFRRSVFLLLRRSTQKKRRQVGTAHPDNTPEGTAEQGRTRAGQ